MRLISIGVALVLAAFAVVLFSNILTDQSNQDTTTGGAHRDALGDENAQPPISGTRSLSGLEATRNRWELHNGLWRAVGTPPVCPDPFVLTTPVPIEHVTSILYPGQERGGEFKPHGGFHFDNTDDTAVNVIAPMDGEVTVGSRYLSDGILQYTFDLIHPCGIMVRFDHLVELAPVLVNVVDQLEPAAELASNTQQIMPPVAVLEGDLLATRVGFAAGELFDHANVFVDFGVYDLRQLNEQAQDPEWFAEHTWENDRYAVCWFDWLAPEDAAFVRSLPPVNAEEGTVSEYCA